MDTIIIKQISIFYGADSRTQIIIDGNEGEKFRLVEPYYSIIDIDNAYEIKKDKILFVIPSSLFKKYQKSRKQHGFENYAEMVIYYFTDLATLNYMVEDN